MQRNAVYLEAPELTQDLLNIKWALRSAGYTIASTWHDTRPIGHIGDALITGWLPLYGRCGLVIRWSSFRQKLVQ